MQPTVAKYPFTRRQQVALLALLAADCFYFSLTSPVHGHSIEIVIGGVLLIMSIYAGCWVIVHLLSLAVFWAPGKERRMSMVLTGPLAYVAFMQSIGQLNMRDIIAVVPVVGVAYFYIVYGYSNRGMDKIERQG